ncbi:MAG: PH domain-containing protein [Candidatus Peregrinibacteria bacterium]
MHSFIDKLNHWFFAKHLEDDEDVRHYVHTHWRLGLKHLFWPTTAFIASWVFLAIAPFLMIFYIVAVTSTLSLIWWIRNFLDYFLDVWLITDQAIIDVKWHGWFHRSATKILFSDIQGVSYEIKGLSGTLLRYGTVAIEKVSTGGKISLEHVSRPRLVAAAILQTMEECLHTKNIKDAKHIQEVLSEVVSREISLKDLKSHKTTTKS